MCQSAGGRDAVPGLESLINSVESWHCAKLVVKFLADRNSCKYLVAKRLEDGITEVLKDGCIAEEPVRMVVIYGIKVSSVNVT